MLDALLLSLHTREHWIQTHPTLVNSLFVSPDPSALKPRKRAVQARSAATLDALLEAALQVLVHDGLAHCTTTRIAERAGLSVGSLYQYFPNRDALLAAVLEKRLEAVTSSVEDACLANRDKPVADMARSLVAAYVSAKRRDADGARALYAIAADRGGPERVARMNARMAEAVAAMLNSASDARFDNPVEAAAIAFNAMNGPVRGWLEGTLPARLEARLEHELFRLLSAYLGTYRRSPSSSTSFGAC